MIDQFLKLKTYCTYCCFGIDSLIRTETCLLEIAPFSRAEIPMSENSNEDTSNIPIFQSVQFQCQNIFIISIYLFIA